MTIKNYYEQRHITEVLHFTTNKGLLGILDSRSLKSRHRLSDDQRLEYILKLNTPRVMDREWLDYVNLSISRINSTLYDISSGKWHDDVWWCILSFEPAILTHDDVEFVTTNNIYPAAKRSRGLLGLENLFSDRVYGRYHTPIDRYDGMPDSFPTCEQAEVLYPGEITTDFLQRIYVATDEEQDDAYGQIAGTGHRHVDVVIEPRKFRGE